MDSPQGLEREVVLIWLMGMCSSWFSGEEDVSSIGGQRPGSWLNGGVSGLTPARVFLVWCFLGGLGLV